MSPRAQWVLAMAGTWAALELLKTWLGMGAALTVAVAALSFTVGAFWGAGDEKRRQREVAREGKA